MLTDKIYRQLENAKVVTRLYVALECLFVCLFVLVCLLMDNVHFYFYFGITCVFIIQNKMNKRLVLRKDDLKQPLYVRLQIYKTLPI